MRNIEFFRHSIDEHDIDRLTAVLKSIFLTTGKEVEIFESDLCQFLSCGHAVGVTSCTAALHLSLIALGIGEGDEVITTPMSFCATANAILHTGAQPIFLDIEEDTANLNAELIEDAITERTKAIIPVHLYGLMCDMKRIREIADKHGIAVIEDAAHAIEAWRDGLKPGGVSDAACFSFYATKNITSGEGGAVVTNNGNLAETIKILRLHGIDKDAAERYTKHYQHWDMPLLGWKYNMDNIHAALLIGQLERIAELSEKRRNIWELYDEKLRSVSTITLLKSRQNAGHARHLFTVLVPPGKRDAVLWRLQDRGVGVAVNYRPIHLLKYYRETFGYKEGDFPVAEKIGARTISLPLYPSLREDEALYVTEVLLEAL